MVCGGSTITWQTVTLGRGAASTGPNQRMAVAAMIQIIRVNLRAKYSSLRLILSPAKMFVVKVVSVQFGTCFTVMNLSFEQTVFTRTD